MFKTALAVGLGCGLLATGFGAASETSAPPRKKLIELGWDIPNTAFLREHWREMEASTPFDGVIFKIEVKGERSCSTEGGWDAQPWKVAWFESAIADLKACRFAKFTDNFLRLNATPGNLDWADDPGWAALAEKVGFCARAVRAGGARGLAPDFESYGAKQFRFEAGKERSFAETAALARKRGAQFTHAIAREYPDAVILSLWLNSINAKAGQSGRPEAYLAASGYGLLPAFINGMLDAAPPGMVLVDGCENGYYMDGAAACLAAANDMRSWTGPAIRLVAPENRAKYRGQVQAGFGFYLDMFLNEPGSRYYFPPLEGSRLKRLHRNLAGAWRAADEYVWVYGEQCRWWGPPLDLPKTAGKGRLWEEAMPGLTRALDWVRDPLGAARAEVDALRKQNHLTNLAVNPQFSEGPPAQPGLPAGYAAWQDEKNATGRFVWDETTSHGSAKAARVKWGCFIQKREVKPGEIYAIEAECLPRGATVPGVLIRWQTPDGRWTNEPEDQAFAFEPRATEWQSAFGVVTVPQEAGYLVILLGVNGQVAESDVCWFDNVGLYRLSNTDFK
jgi:hypothetical protein